MQKIASLKLRWILVATAAAAIAFVSGLFIGPVSLNPIRVILEIADRVLPFAGIDSGLNPLEAAIVWDIRMPRVVLGLLVGGTLAISGGAYQGSFQNPLADPYLLGIASGAGFGVTLAIVSNISSGSPVVSLAAFAGSLAAVVVSYMVGSGRRAEASRLILAGIAVASFFTALQTYLQQQNADTLREVYVWVLGSLSTDGWRQVWLLLPYSIVSAAVIIGGRRVLDVMSLGDDEAKTLGISVKKSRLVILAAASLGTAAAVAVSGLIGFVGIVVPHIVRLVFGRSYRIILPLSFLFGAAFLVFADILAKIILEPAELPIGVITAFVGAPFFLLIIRTSRKNFL